jgi:hypothetical protein
MGVPSYAGERVSYWENSALDSRIYLVGEESSADSQPPAPETGRA